MQAQSFELLEKRLDALEFYGFSVEQEGITGFVVFDSEQSFMELMEKWRGADQFFEGCPAHRCTCGNCNAEVVIELGTLH